MSKKPPNHSGKIAKEATISFIGMGFGDAIRYIFTAVLARLVGVEYLGIFSLASAITRIGETISRAGLQSGVMRFVSRLDKENEIDEIKQRIKSGLLLGLIFSIIIMVIQLIMADWLAMDLFNGSELLKKVIVISAFSLPFSTVMAITAFATQGYKLLKYKVTIMNIIPPLVMLFFVLLSIGIFTKDIAIKYPILISAIISSLVGLYSLKKLTGMNFLEMFKGTVDSELIKFSYPFMFVIILGTLMHWMDILMLGYFTDTSTVGLYHPATRTAGSMRTILVAFMGIFAPIMSEYHHQGELKEMNRLYKLVVRWIISLSLPLAIIMILYSKKVMLLFGGQYLSSANALIVLTISAFIQAFIASSGHTLFMTGFPRVNLMNSTIVIFINIILNYLWIPQYKIMGAAYATLVSMTILAIMRLIEVKMIVKIQPFSIKMLKPIIAGIAMAVVLYGIKPIIFPLHTLLTLSAAVIAGGIIFYVMLWLMKFDRDDKEIWSGISMIIKRNKDS